GTAYIGWGTAYPDFPGIFILAGAGSGALGLDTFSSLTIIVPVVAALTVFPLFLLFRRLYANDSIALLGAAFASVAMPRMFSMAHPAPLALGDFLCVAAIWMFVETRRDTRWFLPLALTSGALIVTHHLSSFMFVLSVLGGLLLLELWRPGLWSRRFPTRELGFMAGFITATLAYWFYGTSSFISTVVGPGLGGNRLVGFGALEGAGLLGVLVVGILIRWRRGGFTPRKTWVRMPSDRSLVRDFAILTVLIFGGIAIVLFIPIPGTSQLTSPMAILWFAPVLGMGILTAGSRRAPSVSRLGPFSLTLAGALGIGAAVTLAATYLLTSTPGFVEAIPASRYVEYLFIPIGLMAAIGVGGLVARAGDRRGRRALVAASIGVILLVAANAAIVYPPQADFGGFQEGYTPGDAALWQWASIGIPSNQVVATDHPLSSAVFGFDGNRATWGSTPALFTGSSWNAAAAELRNSDAPHSPHPIDIVIVDSVMYGGVALDPSAAALPLSAAAIAWFEHSPFLVLYESGQDVTYLVDAHYL
ncbi:MAG: hypothetical protein ABSA15_02600, partial [Thermoplasmata archaeon]